jgi:lycopene beta-cyclase
VNDGPVQNCDVLIAGGGLAGGLIALALLAKCPALDVLLIEAESTLGGNHVWSFFSSDIAAEHRWLVEPLISHRWQGYDVAFPAHARTLDAEYNSIESAHFNRVLRERVPAAQIIQARVASIAPAPPPGYADRHLWHYDVTLDDGRQIKAKQVIDARGPGDFSTLKLGWQKFVGQRLRVPGGHGLTRPIVMDASVEQLDGYRFVYCLPFDAETVFVEDTYYSDTPDLDVQTIRDRISDYAAAKGWTVKGNREEETGVLPVVIGGDFDAYWASTGTEIGKAGLRAGLFQATTGYSLPDAVRLAAQMPNLVRKEGAFFHRAIERFAKQAWRRGRFYRLLDTMLFGAAEPHLRYRVLERFYRLSPPLIARFYAGQSTLADKIRILSGKPPVPIHRAVRAILGRLK